jgi:hypothetical protein
VTTIEVRPQRLAAPAAALLSLAAVLSTPAGVPAVDGDLADALLGFVGSWALVAETQAADARHQVEALLRAAELYQQLEALLVPTGLR